MKFIYFQPIVLLSTVLFGPTLIQAQSCGAVRVRKEIGDYSGPELQALIKAFQALKDDGTMERFANLHRQFASSGHNSPAFFSWHRAYLNNFETELRRVDSSVTLPYWEWTLDSQAPERSMVFKEHYFGGAAGSGRCLPNGPFRNWRYGGSCLSRNFDGGDKLSAFISREVLRNLIGASNQYDELRQSIEYNSHAQVHVAIGGDMETFLSPKDPIFYLHHAFIDKIWASYQLKENRRYFNQYQGSVSATLNPFNTMVRDVMDWERSLCYRYLEPSNPTNRGGVPPPGPSTETPTTTPSTRTPTTTPTQTPTTTPSTTPTQTPTTTPSTRTPTTTPQTPTTTPSTNSTQTPTTTPSSRTPTTTPSTATSTTSTQTSTIPTPTNYEKVCKRVEDSLDLSSYEKTPTYVQASSYPKPSEETLSYQIQGSSEQVTIPGTYDREDKNLIRVPAPLPEAWIRMHNYPLDICRSLEVKVLDLTAQYNNATSKSEFKSFSSLQAQAVTHKSSSGFKHQEPALDGGSEKLAVGTVILFLSFALPLFL